MSALVDKHQRKIRKLRVSLTDNCNLRCGYCMPVDSQFMDENKHLTTQEYYSIIKELIDYGLEEIRLTGGEPLMRKGFEEIALTLSKLPLKKIGLTTNAILLDKHIETLKRARINHINISLDSLNPETFKKITYRDQLKRVLNNIDLALENNMHIKINVVAMKNRNMHELGDFIQYSADKNVELRFLELMRIGYACRNQNDEFISAAEIIKVLKDKHQLTPMSQALDSTSFNYQLENGAKIGFIASESQPFCGHCSRWRLSADGKIFACLLKNEGLSIKNKSFDERLNIYHQLLGMKPYLRPKEVTHQMNSLGG